MESVIASEAPTRDRDESGSLRAGNTAGKRFSLTTLRTGLNSRLSRSQYRSGEGRFTSPRHRRSFRQVCVYE